eukprot:1178051-Prorocentrum_minimum.AAC.2
MEEVKNMRLAPKALNLEFLPSKPEWRGHLHPGAHIDVQLKTRLPLRGPGEHARALDVRGNWAQAQLAATRPLRPC